MRFRVCSRSGRARLLPSRDCPVCPARRPIRSRSVVRAGSCRRSGRPKPPGSGAELPPARRPIRSVVGPGSCRRPGGPRRPDRADRIGSRSSLLQGHRAGPIRCRSRLLPAIGRAGRPDRDQSSLRQKCRGRTGWGPGAGRWIVSHPTVRRSTRTWMILTRDRSPRQIRPFAGGLATCRKPHRPDCREARAPHDTAIRFAERKAMAPWRDDATPAARRRDPWCATRRRAVRRAVRGADGIGPEVRPYRCPSSWSRLWSCQCRWFPCRRRPWSSRRRCHWRRCPR